MAPPVAGMVVFIAGLCVLCGPPAALMQMLSRRRFLASGDLAAVYRAGFFAAAVALAFNLAVAVFATPALAGGALGSLHLVALGISWISFLACVALGILVRRRRNSAI